MGEKPDVCEKCEGHGVIEDWHCLHYSRSVPELGIYAGKVYDRWKETIPCPECKGDDDAV